MTADQPATAPFKYRFWLSFTAIIAALVFAVLAIGALAAGEGLSGDTEAAADKLRVIIIFDTMAFGIFALAVAALRVAYMFFMQKDAT